MPTTTALTEAEEAQLTQTIEMFEVIAQSQPSDYQSLEILKEAYSKLGRSKEVINTSKRIAQSYVLMGQLSSAILEYETILQLAPEDQDVKTALEEIESKANSFPEPGTEIVHKLGDAPVNAKPVVKATNGDIEDGRRPMQKLFVDGKLITATDFDLCWPELDLSTSPKGAVDPFIQRLADHELVPIETSLKLLCDRTRVAYLPLSLYDIDIDLTRTFPAEICQRWCVLPFDRMSRSILVATANPFNQQAAKELAQATPNRLLWYLAPPNDLLKNLRKAFR